MTTIVRGKPVVYLGYFEGITQVVFGSIPSSIGYIEIGTLRPLAVTTATRSERLPEVPVMADFVPGYEMSTWYGIGAPRNTPAGVIDRLNVATSAVLADPNFKARVADLGGAMLGGSPSDLSTLSEEETRKRAKLVKFAGITPIRIGPRGLSDVGRDAAPLQNGALSGAMPADRANFQMFTRRVA
ncbi:Bug family tripartite tricarboxylate transporter substrate binding protein [Bradyrhizobium sp.]|uniref:Bug family tripartite tricarboxylate transporter substrate binding protein n=1 Tax=Bradyrhizobium sp. TaxID=376 RepID=UPI003C72F1F1